MPTYNVHLYRVMRLYFLGIEADTPQNAARLACAIIDEREMPTSYEDCDGKPSPHSLIYVGDKDYSESRHGGPGPDEDSGAGALRRSFSCFSQKLTEPLRGFTEKGKKVQSELPSDDPIFQSPRRRCAKSTEAKSYRKPHSNRPDVSHSNKRETQHAYTFTHPDTSTAKTTTAHYVRNIHIRASVR